jgi:hypothetical protein
MPASSTRTYYFETTADESTLANALEKHKESFQLRYHKHMHYSLGLITKTVGIIQFEKRVPKTVLIKSFADNNVGLDVLQNVGRPMVLAHLRIYLLGEHHDVTSEQTHEFGVVFFWREKNYNCKKHETLFNYFKGVL